MIRTSPLSAQGVCLNCSQRGGACKTNTKLRVIPDAETK